MSRRNQPPPDAFYPMPTRRRGPSLRWLLLALHVIPFAAVVFGYPFLLDWQPEVFDTNLARLIIPTWAGVVVVHAVIVFVVEIVDGIMRARVERRRRRAYRQQHRTPEPEAE